MPAFRGNYTAKVEDGGRLKLPGPFKKLLDDADVTELYITSDDGKSAEVWPLPEWEKVEALLMAKGSQNKIVNKYLDLTSYYGQQVEMDKQARVTLPQLLRGVAKLEGEVSIRGKLRCMKVQNLQMVEADVKANALTDEDRAELDLITTPRTES